jgi:hypothetical protein
MNLTVNATFTEFQSGMNEAVAELEKLAQYCRGRVAIFKRAARRL